MPPKKKGKVVEEEPEETEEERLKREEEERLAEEQRKEEERLEAIRKEEEYRAYKAKEWERHLWIQQESKKKLEQYRKDMQDNRDLLSDQSEIQKAILEDQKRDLQAVEVIGRRKQEQERIKKEKALQPVWKDSTPLSQPFNKLQLLDSGVSSAPRTPPKVVPGVTHEYNWRTPSLVSGLFGEPPTETLSAHMRHLLDENYARDAVRFYREQGRDDLTVAKVKKWSKKDVIQYEKDLNTVSANNRIAKERADFNWDCGHKPFGPPWKATRRGEAFGRAVTLNQSGGGRVLNGQQILRLVSPTRVYDQSPEARGWIN